MRVMREVLQRGFSRRRRCRVPGEPILLCLGGFFLSFYYLLVCVHCFFLLCILEVDGASDWGGSRDVCIYYDGQGYPAIVPTALFTVRV